MEDTAKAARRGRRYKLLMFFNKMVYFVIALMGEYLSGGVPPVDPD
jgi:hypothetical protein